MSQNFFYTSDNSQLPQGGEFDMGGGDFDPIPAKTTVLAAIDEAKWDFNQMTGEEVLSLRWVVLAPEDYKNRKVFQKVRLMDAKEDKRNKAIKMFAAIDANAKGGLVQAGKKPTDDDLSRALLNKPMNLMLQVWKLKDEMTGEKKSGNWVSSVSPKGGGAGNAVPVEYENAPRTISDDDVDAEIPF